MMFTKITLVNLHIIKSFHNINCKTYPHDRLIEQILEATPDETIDVRPLTSHLLCHPIRTKHAGHCGRSTDELIRGVLL